MKPVGKIIGINVLILVGAILLGGFLDGAVWNIATSGGTAFLCACGQLLANLILAIVFFSRQDKERGKAFLLSMLLVGLIGVGGFFTCLVNLKIGAH